MPRTANTFGNSSPDRSSPDRPGLASAVLLDLFSPKPHPAGHPDLHGDDRRSLWAADAVHRARNLAQLSSSLGSTGLRHLLGAQADGHGVQARALSRAYAELGAVEVAGRDVPCGALLEIIATRLIALFAGERAIRLHVSIDYVVLPAEQRRALILIASELVINALKYAFPAAGGGAIRLALTQTPDRIELSVADDGRGIAPHAPAGSGDLLMRRLAALLNAEVHRCDNAPGLMVRVRMPWPAR